MSKSGRGRGPSDTPGAGQGAGGMWFRTAYRWGRSPGILGKVFQIFGDGLPEYW